MSEPTDDPKAQGASAPEGLSLLALAVGTALASLGGSGLLDDTGILPHPAWAVPVAAVGAVCIAIAAATIRRLG